jgi:hypothetical protein
VQFQFQFRYSCPSHASNRLCSLCHCVFRSLREALFLLFDVPTTSITFCAICGSP